MNRKTSVFVGALAVVLCFSFSVSADDTTDIENVIKASYFNGAFNDLDTNAMREGFHPDCAIFSADGEKLGRYPIDTWITGIEKRKADPNFDKSKAKMDCKIVSLDVTGGAAAAKIEISKEGNLVYTDYLSLLKFTDGWKIAAKVYQSHKQEFWRHIRDFQVCGRHTAVLEKALENRSYLLGANLTLADWAIASHLSFAEATGLPMDGFPTVKKWAAKLDDNRAWKNSEPQTG